MVSVGGGTTVGLESSPDSGGDGIADIVVDVDFLFCVCSCPGDVVDVDVKDSCSVVRRNFPVFGVVLSG